VTQRLQFSSAYAFEEQFSALVGTRVARDCQPQAGTGAGFLSGVMPDVALASHSWIWWLQRRRS
jgi:hypothetical protein